MIQEFSQLKLSIRNWTSNDRFEVFKRIKEEVNKELLKIQTKTSKGFSNQSYKILTPGKRSALNQLLQLVGFFNFHTSNNGLIYSVHQINCYMSRGWKMYIRGEVCVKGELEIHHFDHNPKNNHPENLVYVTPYENKLLSLIVRGGFYLGKVINKALSVCKQEFKEIVKQTRQLTLAHFAKQSLN